MKALLKRFVREEEGQDLIEYALLAGFISLVAVAAITGVGRASTACTTTSTTRWRRFRERVRFLVLGLLKVVGQS